MSIVRLGRLTIDTTPSPMVALYQRTTAPQKENIPPSPSLYQTFKLRLHQWHQEEDLDLRMLFKHIDVCMPRVQCGHNHLLINFHYFVIITSVPFLMMFGICIVMTLHRGNTFMAYHRLQCVWCAIQLVSPLGWEIKSHGYLNN